MKRLCFSNIFGMSIVLCFAFLCEFEDCRAQALISPLEIVTEYCQLDFEGARLSSKTWESGAGWDAIAVVSGFKVKTLTTNGNKSEVEIKYDYLGSLSGSTWRSSKDKEASVNRTDRTFVFILEKVDNAWLIKKPMISPHVSLAVVINHLEMLAKNARERGRPRIQLENTAAELQNLAASLSSPEVQTQDVQFDKLTIERLGNHIKSIPGNIDVMAKVDTTFVQIVDVTFDGKPDSVILTIEGESLMHPFVWSLKVRSAGKTIFQHIKDDTRIDKFFDKPGSVIEKHKTYLDSKRYYYFEFMPSNLIDERRFPAAVNRRARNGVYYIAKENLTNNHQVSDQEADVIVETMAERLRSGTFILSVPISAVQSQFPRIYVPEVGAFVVFYQW
ncbi:hypothetical protein IIB79_12830 [candidate division KSB1 bacterium]|nr:hypothetical protein [candidate division KSB1 bacterium]